MDWDCLLADLESRFEAEHRSSIAAQAADLAEAETAAVRLADRLRGAVGRAIRLRTRGGVPVEGEGVRAMTPAGDVIGRIGRVGADYLDVVVDGPRGGNGERSLAGGAPRTGVVTVALGALDVLRSR